MRPFPLSPSRSPLFHIFPLMNRRLLITLAIAAFLALVLQQTLRLTDPEANAPSTEWVPFEEAFSIASTEDRLVLVDIYEQGCKFCRAMERDVYPSAPIQSIIGRYYVPVRLDGRSDEMLQWGGVDVSQAMFAQEMGVTAYPYTIVMTPDGEVVRRQRGYMDGLTFSQWLRDGAREGGLVP
jgi:thioredoxin-related protein